MLRDGFAGQLLPKTAFARGGGGFQKFGIRIVFFKHGVGITRGQQAAADVGIGTNQHDAFGCIADQLQALVGVLGEMAVNLPTFVLFGHGGSCQRALPDNILFLWLKAVSDGLFDKVAVNFGKLVGMA